MEIVLIVVLVLAVLFALINFSNMRKNNQENYEKTLNSSRCQNCGQELHKDDNICPRCGYKKSKTIFETTTLDTYEKSKISTGTASSVAAKIIVVIIIIIFMTTTFSIFTTFFTVKNNIDTIQEDVFSTIRDQTDEINNKTNSVMQLSDAEEKIYNILINNLDEIENYSTMRVTTGNSKGLKIRTIASDNKFIYNCYIIEDNSIRLDENKCENRELYLGETDTESENYINTVRLNYNLQKYFSENK